MSGTVRTREALETLLTPPPKLTASTLRDVLASIPLTADLPDVSALPGAVADISALQADVAIALLGLTLPTMPYRIFDDVAVETGTTVAFYPATCVGIYVASQRKTWVVYNSLDQSEVLLPRTFCYDHSSHQYTQSVLVSLSGIPDTHGTPSIQMDDDGYFYVFWGTHNACNWWCKSRFPYDAEHWGEVHQILGYYTYQHIWWTGEELAWFHRCIPNAGNDDDPGNGWFINWLTDGEWGTETKVLSSANAYPTTYHDADNGVLWLFWDYSDSVYRHNIYCMKSVDGGHTWTSYAGVQQTLPVNYQSTALRLYESGGDVVCAPSNGSIALDPDGNPCLLFYFDDSFAFARCDANGIGAPVKIATTDSQIDCTTAFMFRDANTIHAFLNDGYMFDSAETVLGGNSLLPRAGGPAREYRSTDGGATWTFYRHVLEGKVGSSRRIHVPSTDRQCEIMFSGGGDVPGGLYFFGANARVAPAKMELNWLTFDVVNETHPLCWWDASDWLTVTAAGTPLKLSKLADKSGNGHDLVQANANYQPTVGADTINDLNVMTFGGDANVLSLATVPASLHLTTPTNSKLFFFVLETPKTQQALIYCTDTAGHGWRFTTGYGTTPGTITFYTQELGYWGYLYDALPSTPCVVCIAVDPDGTVRVYINGVLDSAGAYEGVTSSVEQGDGTVFNLFGLSDNPTAIAYQGNVGEIIVLGGEYPVQLGDREKIEAYLGMKWGVTIENNPFYHV